MAPMRLVTFSSEKPACTAHPGVLWPLGAAVNAHTHVVDLVAAFAAFFAFGVLLGGSDDLAVKVSALVAAVLGLTYTRAHGAPALLREAATA